VLREREEIQEYILDNNDNMINRWVTNLRARWNTNKIQGLNNQHLVIGNMNHQINVISGETGKEMATLYDSDHITAVPSVAQFHPSTATPVILTGNGSGRMVCWS